jgi:methyl-accepting chemotaxis protein
MFARLRITTRIQLLLILAAFGFLVSLGIGLWSLRSQMQEDRQTQLRNLLDLTLSIARADMMKAGGPASESGRKAFFSALQSTRFGDEKEANYIFAFDYNGVALSHIDSAKIGHNLIELTDANGVKVIQTLIKIAKSPTGSGFTNYLFPKGAGGPATPKLTLVQNVPDIGGFAGVGVYLDDIDVDFYERILIEGGILLAVLTIIAVTGYLIARSISRPIAVLAANIARLAGGDLDIPSADTSESTELGDIARAVEVFRKNAIEQRELQEKLNESSVRERERQHHFEEQVQKFQTTVTAVVATLTKQVDHLRDAAGTLSEAAETATFEAATAAHVSASAADNSNAVAAATEELSCSIREISDQAHRTNAVVEAATHEAKRTNKDVAGLANAAEEIGSIVAVIRGIADQTNLLALNATIEAARAGEAGRGFAVVAAEVKELSAQTAKATDAIADQIRAIQTSTGTAVTAIQSVAGKVAEIQSFTGAIAAAVEEQTAAAQEIASNVSLAADGSQKAARSSEEVSQIAGKTKQQAASLSGVSLHLSDVTSQLSKAVKDFVAAIRADLEEGKGETETASAFAWKSEVLEAA